LAPFAAWIAAYSAGKARSRGRIGPMSDSFPKLRTDLIVTSTPVGGEAMYTIKDPLTNRFFRLRAPEHYLLTRADGETSPGTAATLTSERFGIVITADAATAFFARMERLLFFDGTAFERELPRLRHMSSTGRRSIGTIRLKAFNPDALLSRWMRRAGFLFTPVGFGVAIMLMLTATVVAVGQHGIWGATLVDLWRLSSIPVLFAAILLIGVVHEFGHAMTLKHYGGSVREMGFLLLYFQPCFYCNLSDSYLLPQRRARAFVGFAGLFFQGVLTAILILLWRIAAPGTWPANFLYAATAFSLGLFLFNLNPMIRLDGYYILADWLGIPNLRSKALRYWRGIIGEWTIGGIPATGDLPPRLRRIYHWYGVGAAVYTGLLLGWILYHVIRFINARWGLAGDSLFVAIILAFALRSGRQAAESPPEAERSSDEGIKPGRRWRKPALFWSGLALIVVLLAIIRAERHVGSICRVDPSARFTISAPSRDAIESELFVGQTERREKSVLQAGSSEFSAIRYVLHVKEGDTVLAGDTLLVLSCNRYQADLAAAESQRERTIAERNLLLSGPKKDQVQALRAEIAEIAAQLDNKRIEVQRSQQLVERSLIAKDVHESIKTEQTVLQAKLDGKKSSLALLISDPKAEELAIKEAQITGFDSQIAFLRSQIEASTLRTPIDGIATRVDRSDVLVEVSDLDPVRVQLSVEESDIHDVRVAYPVSLKVRALPFEEFRGRVTYVASDADTSGGSRQFDVLTEIENPGLMLKLGMSGYSKISCGKSSLLSLISRRAVHFVRVEFWSWW
jgi:putative peptide zinc metalloprotease protein